MGMIAALQEVATFAELQAKLHEQKHTGPVIVHLLHGVPQRVEFPQESIIVRLDRRRRTDPVCCGATMAFRPEWGDFKCAACQKLVDGRDV